MVTLMTTSSHSPSSKGVSREFGYYPISWEVETDQFSIRTLPDHSQLVELLNRNTGILRNWIYPGPAVMHDLMTGEERPMPYRSRIFGLPKTHVLTLHESENPEHLDFVVWCLSFFIGMRLTTTEMGFLDATPVKPGLLVDFLLSRKGLIDAVRLSLDYLIKERADPRASKRVEAVIHALFLAQYPQSLSFEQFTYLYTALDGCFRLLEEKETKKPNLGHPGRIQWMCKKFDMPVPVWADYKPKSTTGFSTARNDTFHEGLFFDQPLGFAVYGGNEPNSDPDNIILQMQNLICRLLVGILGKPNSSYVATPVGTRQIQELKL